MAASQANANDTVLDPSYVLGKCSGRKSVCVSEFGCFVPCFFDLLAETKCQQICYRNLWRQNTTLLLIFPVREIRYYPSIECMIFDVLSRLNITEHQFTSNVENLKK